MELAGKVAVVTGASKGIGRFTAQELAAAGADLVLGARHAETLERVRLEVADRGRRAVTRSTDVRDPAHCAALIDAALQEFGRIDILVNNAGIGAFGPTADVTDDTWRAILDTNLSGVFYCTRAALPHFQRQKSGHIVNISSVAGREGIAGAAAYCASKFGLTGFADALSREVAEHNIRVSTLFPGRVETAFGGDDDSDDAGEGTANAMGARDVARAVRTIVTAGDAVVLESVVLYPRPSSWDE